jgi:hypothetical protein
VTVVHVVLGIGATAAWTLAAVLGGWRWWRVEASTWFWRWVRVGQALLLVEAVTGGVLLLLGDRPGDDLHYVYGLVPLLVSFVAEQLRIVSAETVLDARGLPDAQAMRALDEGDQRSVVRAVVRREIGVMTVAAVVVLGLLLRAELG